jgi:hypothetical protein
VADHRDEDDEAPAAVAEPVAEPDVPLPSWDYPWSPAAESGLLTAGRFTLMSAADLVQHVGSRTAVVAVGSNASPVVLHRKLSRRGVGGDVPFLAGTVTGCAVGHSAHVSLPGYVAAAPYRCAEAGTPVYVSLLDDRQLAALDATEPNYVRRELRCTDDALVLDGTASIASFHLYDSRWGVIAPPGEAPLRLASQEDLHDQLREHWPPYAELLERTGEATTGQAAGVRAVMDRLASDARLRTRVQEALRESGWVKASGLSGC